MRRDRKGERDLDPLELLWSHMPDMDSPGSDSKLKIDLVKAALLKRSDLPYYVTGCKVGGGCAAACPGGSVQL